MNQFYVVIYLENGEMLEQEFWLNQRKEAYDFVKTKGGYLLLASRVEHFKLG